MYLHTNKFILFTVFLLLFLAVSPIICGLHNMDTSITSQKKFTSPDGKIQAVFKSVSGRLTYNLTRNGTMILEDSSLGITINGIDLGYDVILGNPSVHVINENYTKFGNKALIFNYCNEYILPIKHISSGKNYTIRIRLYNDGIAYRYEIPSNEINYVEGEKHLHGIFQRTLLYGIRPIQRTMKVGIIVKLLIIFLKVPILDHQ